MHSWPNDLSSYYVYFKALAEAFVGYTSFKDLTTPILSFLFIFMY